VKASINNVTDTITAKNLELVQSISSSGSKRCTLLGILDRTKTPMGRRLLRMNILQPPCSLNVIEDRLHVVQVLSKSEENVFSIQSNLKQLNDLDRIISYIVRVPKSISGSTSMLAVQHAEAKINHIIELKQTIKAIKVITDCLPRPEEECILLDTMYKVDTPFFFLEHYFTNSLIRIYIRYCPAMCLVRVRNER
jgi:DNA mismatch repair protein MSH4